MLEVKFWDDPLKFWKCCWNVWIYLELFVGFFDSCILTDRALKLILCDFSSNFILIMWPVKFFWSVEQFAHAGLFVGDRQWLSLIMELSSHCYTTLVLETEYKFGYLIAT